MPTLVNPRHEAFAQHRAAGESQYDAYINAGFEGNPSAASQLQKRPEVADRIQEIIADRAAQRRSADDEDTDSISEIDREWIIRNLKKNVQSAQSNGNIGHANKAIELLMDTIGIGKKDRTAPADDESKSDTKHVSDDKLDRLANTLEKLAKSGEES